MFNPPLVLSLLIANMSSFGSGGALEGVNQKLMVRPATASPTVAPGGGSAKKPDSETWALFWSFTTAPAVLVAT